MEPNAGGTTDRPHRPTRSAIPEIRIINFHYAVTVETVVYRALGERTGLFENFVGRLQPILAELPTLISKRVLEGKTRPEFERQAAVAEIEKAADHGQAAGFDIGAVTDAELNEPLSRATA